MASKAKQRWIVGILLASTLGILAMAAPLVKRYTKAHVYDYRIRNDINRHANMWTLGHMKHPAAISFLERYVREPVYRGRVLHELNGRVYKALNAAGIEIPYPKQDVYVKELPKTV